MWKLSKLKKNILEIEPIKVEFEDSYSSIHLRDYYLEGLGISPPCRIDKTLLPEIYKVLSDLVTEINIFKPREIVPNKKVKTDVPGTSKLIRSKDKSKIEIAYRVRNKSGKLEEYATSNNTCYISIARRELFFKHSKAAGYPIIDSRGHAHYLLKVGNPRFKEWSDFMDQEYLRLAGVDPPKRRKNHFVAVGEELVWLIYSETEPGTDLEIYRELAKEGYCKFNDKKTSIYDKDGYWICRTDEYINKDPEGYVLGRIVEWLSPSEVKDVCKILKKFTPYYKDKKQGVRSDK